MPEANPRVVSLDQCYLRHLLRPPEHQAVWLKLRGSLSKSVEAGLIVCPGHIEETIYESVLLPPKDRDAIIALQNSLSGGVHFENFFTLLGGETLKLARPAFDFPPFRIGTVALKTSADLGALATAIRKAKDAANTKASLMPYPPASYVPGLDLDGIFRKLSEERAATMYRVVEAISNTGDIDTGVSEWEGGPAVGCFLLANGIRREECAALMHSILHHNWERIPVYFFHTLLFAKIERDSIETGRRFTMNDHPDVLRAAVALRHADVIACDTYMKEIIRQADPIPDQPPLVFSAKEPDRMLAWVEGLESD